MRRTRIVAATATLALTATTAVLVPASEAAAPRPRILAKHLVSPLTAAVDDDGTAYVTQNFTGQLLRIRPGKKPKVVYASKRGHEVGGVSVFHGKLVFTETASDAQGNPAKTWVRWIGSSGRVHTLARLRAYENRTNPDRGVTYGVSRMSPECAAQWPTEQFGPATYEGQLDSHPYATLQTDEGTVFVADAGMNAVLAISPRGHIRTVAVTPPARVKITAELAASFGMPDCVVGRTYSGESVPTDLALANGKLYVTTEGGGIGEQVPLGSIYRIGIRGGAVKKLVGKLAGPVGLASNARGDLFVSQLFGSEISRIKHGTAKVRTYSRRNQPAAVEWTSRGLYATVNVLVGPSEESPSTPPGGKLIRFRR
ncbi:ScyD/ScyE family protein [Nocardioides sp. URHA0020]|uniref:ScyD/ScyE family protein n=1 Tax=Nocardioides sp. URHA0020 TaxID=1380392 RepID=UPI00068817A5|nr:ScyD/ScyE family protein [Nocardioides sp. URHA0020]